jgi:hypothetical protein
MINNAFNARRAEFAWRETNIGARFAGALPGCPHADKKRVMEALLGFRVGFWDWSAMTFLRSVIAL